MIDELYKALGVISLAVSISLPFVLRWRTRIADEASAKSSDGERDKELQAMSKRIDEVSGRATANEINLNDFRLEAARSFVVRPELERMESKVLEAIRGVQDRLDRVLDRRAPDTH